MRFRLPRDAAPGKYAVYAHNGIGGEYGWSRAADLEITAWRDAPVRVFRARDFGAVGDGVSNDLEALNKAIAAAKEAGGGEVYLAPGTYLVDQSLRLPGGVSLRGSERSNTIIKGFGYDPEDPKARRVWYSPDPIPASVLLLESGTAVRGLTITGYVSRGGGGYALVETLPGDVTFPGGGTVGEILIEGCSLLSEARHPIFDTMLYRDGAAFHSAAPTYRIRLVNNDVRGTLGFGRAQRADILNNRIRRGAIGGSFFDSLIDGNMSSEAPYRMLVYVRRHSYIRSNEVHDFGRRGVSGASEAFLIHGGGGKTMGSPTSVGPDRMTDSRQAWKPGQYKDAYVLISAGRGFGQYRRVLDNTKDTLMLEQPWRVQPDETSEYAVGDFFVESAFFDNFNNGLGRMSVWLDCISVVVDRHRDIAAGGLDVWGRDTSVVSEKNELARPGMYNPAWYNMVLNGNMEGSRISMVDGEAPSAPYRGPILFNNSIVGNTLNSPAYRNAGQRKRPAAGIDFDDYQMNSIRGIRSGRTTHTVIADNTIAGAEVGIRVPQNIYKTFLIGNIFENTAQPILDRGMQTRLRSNSTRAFNAETAEPGLSPIKDVTPHGESLERPTGEAH